MNLFNWLFVSHLIGDFLLQSDDMATNKGQHWPWMLRHVSLYMIVISIVLVAYTLNRHLPFWSVAAVWIFFLATHILLDRRGVIHAWMRLVGMSPDHPWLPIVVDQVLHVLTLAIAAQILVLIGA
jgi:hypothetical protein